MQITQHPRHNKARWMSRRRSKRVRSLPMAASQACVRSTTQRCLPSRSLLSIPLRAIRAVIPPPAQVGAAATAVVSLVSVQFGRPAQRSATLAADGWQGIHQPLEYDGVMPIGPGDTQDQWRAVPVSDQAAFAAELASICRVRACFRPPPGAGDTGTINTGSAQIKLVRLA